MAGVAGVAGVLFYNVDRETNFGCMTIGEKLFKELSDSGHPCWREGRTFDEVAETYLGNLFIKRNGPTARHFGRFWIKQDEEPNRRAREFAAQEQQRQEDRKCIAIALFFYLLAFAVGFVYIKILL